MESHELRVFQAVAKAGSITKAAQNLGYVQSNVTARVQQLEDQLGTQLFYRQRGMVLTSTGEKLLTFADRIIQLLEEAEQALSESSEPSGRLLLGANQKVAALHLPSVLAKYHKVYPAVELSLVSDSEDELVYKLLHFQLDAAFVKSFDHVDKLVADLVFVDELVLISSLNDTKVQDVYEKPFLMNSVGCAYREGLENWLHSEGITHPRFMEFNHFESIIAGVMAGLGASLVPRSAIQKHEEDGLLRVFPISPEHRVTKTFLIRHKDRLMTNALKEFIEMVEANSPYQWNL